jgi:hypothetical protein
MRPVQRGHVRRLPSGKVQLRYYGNDGEHRSGGVFATKSAAYQHFRDTIEPMLLGTRAELTLAELVDLYVKRHESIRSARTIRCQTAEERAEVGAIVREEGDDAIRRLRSWEEGDDDEAQS